MTDEARPQEAVAVALADPNIPDPVAVSATCLREWFREVIERTSMAPNGLVTCIVGPAPYLLDLMVSMREVRWEGPSAPGVVAKYDQAIAELRDSAPDRLAAMVWAEVVEVTP